MAETSLSRFLVDAEEGAAGVETTMLLIVILPFLLIPAMAAKLMAEYFAYVSLVTASPFM